MLANCVARKGGSSGGDARLDRGGGGGVKAHERVITIKDHGLNVHILPLSVPPRRRVEIPKVVRQRLTRAAGSSHVF